MPPRNQKAGLTTRKMAKKGGQASFQAEVNSDEEWRFLLQKVGLVVIDVYSDWCGPCVGMMSNLKKVKLEVGNENLHLAMANADKIKALARFRGRSEPTWVFLATGQLLKVMYGSNAPLLMRTIEEELSNEMECIEGKRTRIVRAFNEPTPEELEKLREIEEKRMAELEEEKREKEEQLDKIKRRYYERVARKLTKQTVVLYFPHTFEETDKKKICPAAYKLMAMYDQVDMSIKDQLEIQLTEETIPKVFYNSGIVLPKTLLNVVVEMPCIASLIQEYELEKTDEIVETPSIEKLKALEHLDVVEKKLSTLVYGPEMDIFNPAPGTVCAEFMVVTPMGVKVPALWTPKEHISKAAALEVLFPMIVGQLGIEMEPLPPPAYVMIFEANRAREILDAAEPFAEDVLHIAFFDSAEPDKATKICHTVHELEKFSGSTIAELKMVIALQKKRSDPMLVLAQMGPLYISGDVRQGVKEVEMFFPPTIEEEFEPDPWAPAPEGISDDGEYLVDEDGHRYREEFMEDEQGEAKLMKRVIRLADGTPVDMVIEYGARVKLSDLERESGRDSEDEEGRESQTSMVDQMDEGEKPSVAALEGEEATEGEVGEEAIGENVMEEEPTESEGPQPE